MLTVPLQVQMARCPGEGQPVRSQGWLQAHVDAANAVFNPHHVHLAVQLESFASDRCDLIRASDRNAMATYVPQHKAVCVLVVNKVQDLDMPSYNLMGVHWRYAGAHQAFTGRRWIFLTARAEPPVLAHEVCHYFGLPHDPKGGNLMTPGPSAPAWKSTSPPAPFAPVLTASQAKALRTGISAWAQSKRKP